jgi:hypothetical protein
MYNRTLLIGRIGHNAEAKTDKDQQEYLVLSIATRESWKNDQGRPSRTASRKSTPTCSNGSRKSKARANPWLNRPRNNESRTGQPSGRPVRI